MVYFRYRNSYLRQQDFCGKVKLYEISCLEAVWETQKPSIKTSMLSKTHLGPMHFRQNYLQKLLHYLRNIASWLCRQNLKSANLTFPGYRNIYVFAPMFTGLATSSFSAQYTFAPKIASISWKEPSMVSWLGHISNRTLQTFGLRGAYGT